MFKKYALQDNESIMKAIGTPYFIMRDSKSDCVTALKTNTEDNINDVFDCYMGNDETYFASDNNGKFAIIGVDGRQSSVCEIYPCKSDLLADVMGVMGNHFSYVTIEYRDCDFERYDMDDLWNNPIINNAHVYMVEEFHGVFEITAYVEMKQD